MARKKTPTGAIATVGESTKKKRVGPPPKPSAPSASNVSDATFQEFAAQAMAEKKKLDEQSGKYRDVLKKAKAAGVPTKAITDWLKDKARDPLELAAEQRAKARLYKLMGMPAGTQFSLLDEAPATDKDRGAMQHDAYEAGRRDGLSAADRDDDRYPNDTDLQTRYDDGYSDGQAENARAIQSSKANGTEAHA